MGQTKQESHLIAHRRHQVGELYLQGLPQISIAQELGVSQATVCRDLRALHKQWRESDIRDFDQAVTVQLKKLDRVEREAWAAWERSKQPLESTTVVSDGSAKRAQKLVKQQAGDPRYLELALKCSAARRALLGLDAPTKISPTSPDGEQSYHAHVMMELMRLTEGAQEGPQVIDAAYIERTVREASSAHGAEGQIQETSHDPKA